MSEPAPAWIRLLARFGWQLPLLGMALCIVALLRRDRDSRDLAQLASGGVRRVQSAIFALFLVWLIPLLWSAPRELYGNLVWGARAAAAACAVGAGVFLWVAVFGLPRRGDSR